MKIFRSNNAQPELDYWKKVADKEFESMDDEGKNQWEELRRITR